MIGWAVAVRDQVGSGMVYRGYLDQVGQKGAR
jgi:hypothetical protein